MHRLDGGDEAFAAGQFPVADLAGEMPGQLARHPLFVAISVEVPHAFFGDDDQFLLGVVVPVHRVEVVRLDGTHLVVKVIEEEQ